MAEVIFSLDNGDIKTYVFTIKFSNITCDIQFSFGNNITKERWIKFIENVNNKLPDYIIHNFCGIVGISTRQGQIIFKVEKYGSGTDGYTQITVPGEYCQQAFMDLLSSL